MNESIDFLKKLNSLNRGIEQLKRDWLKSVSRPVSKIERKSLYGSVCGGDITEVMIEDAKKSLFRDLQDI